jgi:hypothetical protein
MTEWLDDPDGTVLSLRRHTIGGQRSQWAVAKSGDGYAVWGDAGSGVWQLGATHADPAAAIAAVPALTQVHKGEASFYTLDDRLLNLHDFAALLDCCPAEGTDDESEWPDQFAGEWKVIDGEIDGCGGRGFAAILRLATVERTSEPGNPYERTVVAFWAEHSGRHTPLLAANERLIARKEIAGYYWAVDNTGAPMSSAGSVVLVSVADGVAASIPGGDEIEMGREFELVDYPPDDDPDGQAEALAEWIADVEATFSAAVWLEPLDPYGEMTDEEQADWEAALDSIDASFSLEAGRDLRRSLRRQLAGDGLYCSVRAALADPDGEEGRALKDSLGSGDYGEVVRGSWS